ncbi:hypothetical protein CDL12_12829 [Handroanthus impetiginosus]|uniref:DUF4378 domain-containing protein n=1 Tax=Handroanthus impetiginosus TaxID=429701 RepID=A0A2G9HAN6_9LAMI|nr:hypothetical protein CDL12_12829 [Handroanthus impetiginosus]
MSVKRVSSVKDENRDLRKQIGCMNGIFQLFDRHHFLTGPRISSHNHKRLPQGAQNRMDPQYAMKVVMEVQKEKPRSSTESSRASFSSSSCSSTFSSLDCNKVPQPEALSLRQINIRESVLQTTSRKEEQLSLSKSTQTPDLRDVVKDSMYREARGLSIKPRGNDERRGTVMKHIDSPRPAQQPKGSTQVLAKNSKDDHLAPPRYSYDGRETRETFKSTMKLKELPRLSLDSKASSIKRSALEYVENEPGSHRTSSVVARLMGLEAFPDIVSTDENRIKPCHKEASISQSLQAEERKQHQITYSDSPRNFVHKPNTRFPIEPAPWRQQEPCQGSPRMAAPQSRKVPANTAHLSSSVYGEIEKRITELEFKRSGKDLRALKQILEAMQKKREQLEDQKGESAEFPSQRKTDQNLNLSMWRNRKSCQQVPSVKGPCSQKQLESSAAIVKPAKVMDRVKLPVSTQVRTTEISLLQRLEARSPKYNRENSAHRQKAKDLAPKNKKTTWGTSERSLGMVSPRLQQNLLRLEGQSCPTTPSSDSGRAKKHCNKKVVEKGSQNRKPKVKVQLSDDQLSEISSETRYSSYQGDTASVKSESNNSIVSQAETGVISLAHSIKTNLRRKEDSASTRREHMPAVESSVTMLEQPSPISVLDDSFYSEDSPSPVKKKSTAFQDESPSPDAAEWNLENLNNLTDCKRSSHGCKYNQKLQNIKHSVHELRLPNNEPDETAENHTASVYSSLNPDPRYINKILLTSGLLKDSSFVSTTDQLLPSHHLINPDMFHVLEQTEEIEKNDSMKLNKKIQRKIIFDMVDEILVRKITSGRLFPVGNKRTSPQGLLKEVYLEMDHVCRIEDRSLDDNDDEVTRLLTADMMYQSEDWANYSGEVPSLVLDIERQIFKDLINEVVNGEVMGLHDLPKRHCRQLFSK